MPQPTSSTTTRLDLAEAEKKASHYEWMAATDLYQRALRGAETNGDPSATASITELVANGQFRAAFQAENREQFKEKMKLSAASFERAAGLYEKAHSAGSPGAARARSLSASFWLAENFDERRSIIVKCVDLAEEAVSSFELRNNKVERARTRLDILGYLLEESYVTPERKTLADLLGRTLDVGRKAVKEFEELGDQERLAQALHAILIFQLPISLDILEPARYKETFPEISRLKERLREVSDKVATPLARCLAEEIEGWTAILIEGDDAKGLGIFENAVKTAETVNDSYLEGQMRLDVLRRAAWLGLRGEDVEQRRDALEKGIAMGERAIKNFEISRPLFHLELTYDRLTDCISSLGRFVEHEADRRILQFKKAIEVGRRGKEYALYPDANHALSKALFFLASMEGEMEEKKQLLTEALRYREQAVKFMDILAPYSWNRGIQRNYQALIEAELSNVESDINKKVELLRAATNDMEQCLQLCTKWVTTPAFADAIADYSDWYGDILYQLYGQTNEKDSAERSIRAYESAIDYRRKAGLGSPVAPIRWKIAKVHDFLGDYKRASDAFKMGAEDYTDAAKKVRSLAAFFGELASYMEAWSLIEEARLRHRDEQYSLAAESYGMAASILKPTRAWTHLSRHYTACSSLEKAEALSRQESQEAAIEAFNTAAKTFEEVKQELENKLEQTIEPQDKREIGNWIEITRGRQRYCLARIELEDAKILDRKGEEEPSSEKYRSASEAFKQLHDHAPSQESRRELETLMLFCEAWAKMKQAEVEASPEHYIEAAEAFQKAKEATPRKKFRFLALANASMCRALEAGTRFRLTRNTQLYSEVKKHLETAADYYQQGGFQNDANWTQATQRLFDALVYMADAETARDPRKKTELFHLTEKHLQMAAGLYGDAGYSSKKEEALRHLKRARGEKELLLTPIEALSENPALARGEVAPVSLVRDQAGGLERFETANVVGNLSLSSSELGIGADVIVELEFANVGKTAATLVKLENVAPDGLKIDKEKIPHRVEDNYLDMRGKRLEYLKTYEVKIPMKAARKGSFELKPRVLFVDELGNYRSYEFEPTHITVRELGISGWLKGPK